MEEEKIVKDISQKICKSCGGKMTYSPSAGKLVCEYCGAAQEGELEKAEVQENDFEYWASHQDAAEEAQPLQAEVRCKQCGACTTLPSNTVSYACAFCGSPIILSQAEQKRSWKPEYMLPFKVDKKQCNACFAKWIKSLWFLPSEMTKKETADDRFKGVYLPYWTYDAHTDSSYEGERGTDRIVVTRGADGKDERRTVTDWTAVSGEHVHDFDDVLIPASDSLPQSLANVLTNWDRENYVPCEDIYMSGFLTEIYQKDFIACYPEAQHKMEQLIKSGICDDIGGQHQRVHRVDTHYSDVKFKHVLLPVWISAFRYKNKSYIFAINGRTGNVVGQRPYSAGKIAVFVVCIIAILVLIFKYLG